MIIKVKVDEKIYEVEIEAVDTNPIIARIDGDNFEAWTEVEIKNLDKLESIQSLPAMSGLQSKNKERVVSSPIPGVVSQLFVQPGQKVQARDPLLVIEAMKMNNTIRSSRSGTIEQIKVEKGSFVKHHQVLIEYTD